MKTSIYLASILSVALASQALSAETNDPLLDEILQLASSPVEADVAPESTAPVPPAEEETLPGIGLFDGENGELPASDSPVSGQQDLLPVAMDAVPPLPTDLEQLAVAENVPIPESAFQDKLVSFWKSEAPDANRRGRVVLHAVESEVLSATAYGVAMDTAIPVSGHLDVIAYGTMLYADGVETVIVENGETWGQTDDSKAYFWDARLGLRWNFRPSMTINPYLAAGGEYTGGMIKDVERTGRRYYRTYSWWWGWETRSYTYRYEDDWDDSDFGGFFEVGIDLKFHKFAGRIGWLWANTDIGLEDASESAIVGEIRWAATDRIETIFSADAIPALDSQVYGIAIGWRF